MTGRICGTGSYVPARIVENDELANLVDTNDAWIRERTGIARRHLAENETTSYMAAEAAKRALAQSDIPAEDVDLILVATSTPDHCFPNAACMVQAAIGAERAVAYDISAACSGFLFAVNTAHAFLGSGIYKTALVIGADTLSKIVDWSDRSTCVLFGDGAGAAVLRVEEGEKSGIFAMKMGSDGKKGPVLSCVSRTVGNFLTNTEPQIGYTTMDGQEVFKFAVKKVPETIKELLDEKLGYPAPLAYNDWVEANHYQELNDAQKNWLYRQELGYIESLKGMTVREIAEQRIEEITTALRKYML